MADQPDDGLTDGERKLFNSRGEDFSGIPAEELPPPSESTVPEVPSADAPPLVPDQTPPAEATAPDDDDAELPEPAPDPKTGKKPPRHVHFNKFKKLEERYNALQAEASTRSTEVSTLRETMARADERLKLINEALAQPAEAQKTQEQLEEEADPRPDPKEDIFGHSEWQERRMARMERRYQENINTVRAEQYERAQQETLLNNYRNDAVNFARSQPAFVQAYQYLNRNRDEELAKAGIRDPNQRVAIKRREESDLVAAAFNEGISPSQRIYDIAVTRGFNPAAMAPPAAAPAPPPTVVAPAGAPPLAAPARQIAPVAAAPNVGAEIAAIQAGQAASFSLGNAGGSPAPTLTPEVLGNMSDEEFGRLYDSLPRDKLRQLLPGA